MMRVMHTIAWLCLAMQLGCYNSPLGGESTNGSGSGQQATNNIKPFATTMERVVQVTPSLGTISFGADGLGFVGSSDQRFWTSVDGGAKWNEGRIPYGGTMKNDDTSRSGGWYDLVRSAITATGHIHAIGHLEESGSLVSSSMDAGRTWKNTEYPNSTLNDIDFAEDNVWIVGTIGSSAVVLKGSSLQQWQIIWKATKGQYFEGVDFVDSTSGWIVGAKGLILRGFEGGRKWEPQQSPTLNNLRSVSFADSSHGFIVGEQGTILHTNDGGLTWLKSDSGTQAELTRVFAMSRDEACAVGRNGTVLLTADGGTQWFRQNLGTEVDVYALAVKNREYWVGVSDGTVFRLRAQ
jgi:photosystem II stability/assembly factor-like uncharacterized protein